MNSYEIYIDDAYVMTCSTYEAALEERRRLVREHPKSKITIKRVRN